MKKMYKYKYVLIPIALIAIYLIFFRSSTNTSNTTITVRSENFAIKLSVVGSVEAPDTANLGFSQSGRVSSIKVKVGDFVEKGDVLANIENGDLQASLIQKQAVLEKERANLATKIAGTRPEELSITSQKYDDAVSAYITALHTAYFKVEQALLTKVDTVFNNGNTSGLSLKITTDSRSEQLAIENERLVVTEKLLSWKNSITSLDSRKYTPDELMNSQKTTSEVLNLSKILAGDLSRITGKLSTSMGYTQTSIDTYRSSINDAGQEILSASQTFDTAQSALNTAKNNLALEKAGSTQNELNAQAAIVKAAEADVLSAQSQLEKTIVRAPFDGIVSKMDAKLGEIASSNTSNISMISNGLYLIKSNVPEVYISNLKVGNTASTTLDAYGPSVVFPLTVIAIDPAQTVVNGVSNYKTTLQFSPANRVIRPGMTANVVITTDEIPNAIVVPKGSVFTKNDLKYVQVKKGNNFVDQEVELGSASTVGEVQIVSGLKDGDIVLLSPIVK